MTDIQWEPTISARYNGDFIALIVYSGVSALQMNLEVQPLLLSKDASNEELGKAVLEALSKSERCSLEDFLRRREEWKERYVSWIKFLMEKYGYRNKSAIIRKMMDCGISLEEGTIRIWPSRHERGERWSGEGIPDAHRLRLPASSSPEEIGAALWLSFSRCRGNGAELLFRD